MVKEKELRLALVCYGGVSLAVYMHGVTKEILKLARASRAYHAIPDPRTRRSLSFAEAESDHADEHDSEHTYFEILKAIGARLDLRVVVDVIAGASAGGINGVILARALAHNLGIDGLRDVWLAEADVSRLLAPDGKASWWNKWFLRPLIWGYLRAAMRPGEGDAEMRRKLSLFLRSRWFRPPFDGARFSNVLLEGIGGMAAAKAPESSLLPRGQRLELFITVTDFYGYLRRIRIHDPTVVSEREHRHMLRFEYCHWPSGDMASDFGDENVPGLCFAARATASFPGAFPPAQIAEFDRLMAARKSVWRGREAFLESNFQRYHEAAMNPLDTSFVDGSVLNNKPFAAAIESVRERPALRQVDRRLVYIDPDPQGPPPPPNGQVPGFFRTLKAALSDIPRQEPVYDDLNWIAGFNLRVRRANAIIDATRPDVGKLVADLAPDAFDGPISAERVGAWRETASAYAAGQTGFAYNAYRQLKLLSVTDATSALLAGLCGWGHDSEAAEALGARVRRWVRRSVLPREGGSVEAIGDERVRAGIEFLRRFDLDFRRRRLRFVVQSLNRIYSRLGEESFAGLSAERLDRIKGRLYERLDALRVSNIEVQLDARGQRLRDRVLARGTPAQPSEAEASKENIAASASDDIDSILGDVADILALARHELSADELFAEISAERLPGEVTRELLTAYIGFAFWDILTFPITSWRDLGEFDEIRIDRISPDDARSIRDGGAAATLKGIEFGHFGAFFSRGHRENDYLWGRLHGAERLIDLLYDAAALEGAAEALDRSELKKNIFLAILTAERRHLPQSGELIATLEREIAGI